MTYSIILAGGIGSRFWPLSTDKKPKQFLSLCSNQSLMVESINRASLLTPRNNIYIATNKIHKNLAFDCLKKMRIPKTNFFFEKKGKNTLAPISALTRIIYGKDKEAVIAVFPSDHFMKNKNTFLGALKKAVSCAKDGSIVTLGIRPQRPETGFGYIKVKSKVKSKKKEAYEVDKFIEKPRLQTAKRLMKDKNYYWNAGIFIFKAAILLEEIKRFQPKVYKILAKVKNLSDLDKVWHEFSFVSIDYAIMERSDKLKLIPLDCGWSDLGSWRALEEIRPKDKNGNIIIGKNIDLGSKNTIVWSEKLIVTLGLNGLIIVDTSEGLLVCSKDKAQEVKKAVELLKLKKG